MAHDGPDLLPHLGPVAVDGAVGAGGFLRPEGAFVESFYGVGKKPRAIGAQFALCAVAIPAEDPDHGLQGFALPLDSAVVFRHGDNIMRPAPDGKHFPRSGPAATGWNGLLP